MAGRVLRRGVQRSAASRGTGAERQLSADRVMAWHLRNALGDALWRSEAGIPLADHRTPPQWVEDMAARFSALGIHPEAPAQAARASAPPRAGRRRRPAGPPP